MRNETWIGSLLALALTVALLWFLVPPVGTYLVENGWLKPGPGYTSRTLPAR